MSVWNWVTLKRKFEPMLVNLPENECAGVGDDVHLEPLHVLGLLAADPRQ